MAEQAADPEGRAPSTTATHPRPHWRAAQWTQQYNHRYHFSIGHQVCIVCVCEYVCMCVYIYYIICTCKFYSRSWVKETIQRHSCESVSFQHKDVSGCVMYTHLSWSRCWPSWRQILLTQPQPLLWPTEQEISSLTKIKLLRHSLYPSIDSIHMSEAAEYDCGGCAALWELSPNSSTLHTVWAVSAYVGALKLILKVSDLG